MFRIKTMNKIAASGLARFGANYECAEGVSAPDAILVRSASLHDVELPDSVQAIARAGAGVNNIPVEECSKKGVVVFNTPGANANAVKELVLAGLLLSSRKIVPAIDWARTLKGSGDEVGKMVEKGKGAFTGPEIAGKTLGVIGLGAIGIMVANSAGALGMNVLGYDPYLSVSGAWHLSNSVVPAASLKEVFANSDYITVHVPLSEDTKNMINAESIASMKEGVRILNFSRAALVCDADITEALREGKVSAYVTDFPTDGVLGVEGVIAIPHLGASTPESEENCAQMAADQLIDFLENGNIRNSVNLPAVSAERSTDTRICVIHENIPDMLAQMAGMMSRQKINIENMVNKSRGNYAYTILDIVASDFPAESAGLLSAIDGIISVRVIH